MSLDYGLGTMTATTSEQGSALKGKKMLQWGANSFLLK